jgi:hypothetical protein
MPLQCTASTKKKILLDVLFFISFSLCFPHPLAFVFTIHDYLKSSLTICMPKQ